MSKNQTVILSLNVLLALLTSSCKKETTPEQLLIQTPTQYSAEYYSNLRAYKASDHAKCFIWLSDYNTTTPSASPGERFAGVPDSVDIISLWGGLPDKEKNKLDYEEMRYVQKVKGIKILSVVIVNIGYRPHTDAGIQQYIADLKKEVFEADLDGLDLDYEPSDGFFENPENFTKLVAGLSQFLGPKSGTGKILDIDYFNLPPPAVLLDYVDFVVFQIIHQS